MNVGEDANKRHEYCFELGTELTALYFQAASVSNVQFATAKVSLGLLH